MALFVGRERELSTLDECLEEALSNSGQLVLISGEPGIGKTRLAEELTRRGSARGFLETRALCPRRHGHANRRNERPDRSALSDVRRARRRITHQNDEAIVGAIATVRALQHLGAGDAPRELLGTLIDELSDTALSDSLRKLTELPDDATALDAAKTVGASGRTAESVALALFLGTRTVSVEDAIIASIQCGGDADTIAALAAQLRASAGEETPSSWWPHLPAVEARRLSDALQSVAYSRNGPKRRWGIF